MTDGIKMQQGAVYNTPDGTFRCLVFDKSMRILREFYRVKTKAQLTPSLWLPTHFRSSKPLRIQRHRLAGRDKNMNYVLNRQKKSKKSAKKDKFILFLYIKRLNIQKLITNTPQAFVVSEKVHNVVTVVGFVVFLCYLCQ